jgi:hypothetical protein
MALNTRWEAFMASFGRADHDTFNTTMNRCDFMAWIARCKASAPAAVKAFGHIADHDAFTAHCWQVAREDALRRFPA